MLETVVAEMEVKNRSKFLGGVCEEEEELRALRNPKPKMERDVKYTI